jgi:hypothetical protein
MATTDTSVYIPHSPGDLITADDWNGLQRKIKDDIHAQVEAGKEEVKHEGVDKATNAEHFEGMSEKELEDKLDQRYAPKVHDHEGQSAYRRFIKEFSSEPGLDKVLLRHELGRFPLVDVYELHEVVDPVLAKRAKQKRDLSGCKILFYYGHADADALGLRERVGRERVGIGIPFEEVLHELAVKYEDDDQIEDVLNDMWDAFMKDPNDEIKHCTTDWVDECCGERRTVAELKEADDWDDLYVALRPRKCGFGEGQTPCRVVVDHVNYSTALVTVDATAVADEVLDLMILMRS